MTELELLQTMNIILGVSVFIFITAFIVMLGLYCTKGTKITDDAPARREKESEHKYRCNCIMKLQNELADFVKIEKGKIKIKLIK